MYKKLILIIAISLNIFAAQTYKKIEFSGLTQISNEIAIENIKLTDNTYTTDEINNAIKSFYKFDYFTNIYVTDENSILTFHFTEKPFIANLEMTGYKNREDELKMLYSSMGLKKGTMYSQKKMDRAKKALLLALEREGYINSVVEVTKENINETSVLIKFEVNKGEAITITKMKYIGAKALNADDFEDVIANKETDVYFTWFFGRNDGEMDFEQLEYDSSRIKDLYLQHGYLDAKVTAAFSEVDFNTNTATVEYTIIEGEQYKVKDTIIYLDESILDVDILHPELKLEQNDVFNISHLRKDQEYIKTQVADKGYAYTVVNFDIKPNKENHTVNIVYNVVPGDKVYINDVIISGNNRTLDRVIRRDVYLAPNDLYNLTDYKDSKNALQRTGYFESVDIKQQRVTADKMNLIVDVKEAATGNLMVGGGYGSYDGWLLNLSVNDKNIFGSGLNLGVSYEHSDKRNNYTVSLTNPAIRDSEYNGSFDIHNNETDITYDDDDGGEETTIEKGFGLGIGKSLNRYTRVGINYSYNRETVNYEYPTDTNKDDDFTTSAITPYISFNNTDDYYVPREGVSAGTSLKYAGLGEEVEYILSSTYFKYFYSFEDLIDYDVIFRYKNSIKVLKDTGYIPDSMTFYLGGPSSVRGYSSYAFDPDDYDHNNDDILDYTRFGRYFTNTIELSFPLVPSAKMRWALFYDYGMVGEKKFDDIKKSGNGAVISWYSPVGPLQFIFARAINPEDGDDTSNFEFSLGTKF